MKPRFRLASATADPVETILAVWANSRPSIYPEAHAAARGEPMTARFVKEHPDLFPPGEATRVFREVVSLDVPVSEVVHFTWTFDGVPIEWREQAVRSRRTGFWLTSMREFSMEGFGSEGRWAGAPRGALSPEASTTLSEAILASEKAYRELVEFGAPIEIARKVIPLCATHGGAMFSTLRTLLDTLNRRSCFIAQIDLWGDFLRDTTRELALYDPAFAGIVSPPCFARFSNEYRGCKFCTMNRNRLSGEDPYAPCPIYMAHEGEGADMPTAPNYLDAASRTAKMFGEVWNRNPISGELL